MAGELLKVEVLWLRVSVRLYKAFGFGITFEGPAKLLVGPFGVAVSRRTCRSS